MFGKRAWGKSGIFLALLLFGSAPSVSAIDWNDTSQKYEWVDDLSISVTNALFPIKRDHFIELRDAIDLAAQSDTCNVLDPWNGVSTATRDGIGVASASIEAVHVNALRQAVRNLYTEKGQSAAIPSDIQGTLSPGTIINGSHIAALQQALDTLVRDFCITPPSLCGNGTIDPPEECDLGAGNSTACDGCSLTCTNNPVCMVCGDGTCAGSENATNCAADCACVAAVALNAYAKGTACCRGDGACGPFTDYCIDARNPTASARFCLDNGYNYVLNHFPNPGAEANCGGCRYQMWGNTTPAITSTTDLSTFSNWPTPSYQQGGCDICRPTQIVYCSDVSPAVANVVWCGNGVCDACAGEDANNCEDCVVCGDGICSPGEVFCWGDSCCVSGSPLC